MNGPGIIRIFAGQTGRKFAQKMCDYLGTPLGSGDTLRFSEGNTFVRINETIRDKDVYIVQPVGRDPNNEFVELLFWIDAFKRASANSVTAIMPYFSYAKGDKKDEPRVSIRARVCAESIELAGADRVITMELHSPQVQGFFKKPLDHLFATPLLCEYIVRSGMVDENLVVVSPDAGFAKRARDYADLLHTPVAIGEKIRVAHDENAKVMNIIGEVKGKNCLIVDDFSISAGTLTDIAREIKEQGANHIYAAITHSVMGQAAVDRIQNSPIEKLIVTDTVICPELESCAKVKVISAAPLFAEAVKVIHDNHSMGSMLGSLPESVFKASFE